MGRPFALGFNVRRGDFPNLTQRVVDLSANFPQAFRVALYDEATKILAASRALVPIKTGRLFRSGRVYWPSEKDPRIDVQYLAPYALAVHERHATKAKFLERAINEALPGMARRIARRIAKDVT